VIRERALKVVLVIVGLLFVASLYGLMKLREEETLQMMLSIYGTLGVFLLLASRNPSANRSLIAFPTLLLSCVFPQPVKPCPYPNAGEDVLGRTAEGGCPPDNRPGRARRPSSMRGFADKMNPLN
jgi:hypothetical protein